MTTGFEWVPGDEPERWGLADDEKRFSVELPNGEPLAYGLHTREEAERILEEIGGEGEIVEYDLDQFSEEEEQS